MAGRRKTTETSNPAATSAALPGYPVQELMAESEAFLGVKPEVLAGAVAGEAKTMFQVDEAKKLIKQFLEKKVL